MLITMLADRFLAGGVLCAKGTQVDVATEQALRWIGENVAAAVGLSRETAQGIRKDVPVVQDQISGQQTAAGAPVSGAGNVRYFGAKCDLVCLMVVSTTAGSDIFNAVDAVFTNKDIGKTLAITGAGAALGATSVADGATLYGPHVTTIADVLSPTQVRMAAPAVRSVSTQSGTGIQYVFGNATAEGGAKAFYGTDDTASLQGAVDALHPADGVILIPAPTLVLGSVYCQRSRDTSSRGLLWKRLEFRGIGPTAQGPLTGAANQNDSILFKPTPGAILVVNKDASGAGMTSTGATPTHQFYNFNVTYIAFHGLPGLATIGMDLHRVRAGVSECTFNNLALGWDGLSADVNGSPNYCDQWTVRRPRFNNCAQLFKQYDADACDFLNVFAESHYPTVVNAIELTAGRGWQIKLPLINNLPRSAKIGLFTNTKEGAVSGGHFENIYGNGFTITGSNGNTWVDIERCDWFNPAAGAAITHNTIEYTAAGGRVVGNGFSHNRSSGFDIKFNSSRHQEEKNNHHYEADNSTRRYPSVDITVAGGNIGTTFRQPYFVNVVYTGAVFDIRNVNNSSMWASVMTGNPAFNGGTGRLNLDGPQKWGRPNAAWVVQKAGKYRPVLVDVYTLQIEFYNDAGTKVTTPDTNMDCYLFVM